MLNKKCAKCKKEFPINHFSKESSKKDGLHSRCKVCVAKYCKVNYSEELDKKATLVEADYDFLRSIGY
jgi:NAD-dependent SIR2 family protein deacetylase